MATGASDSSTGSLSGSSSSSTCSKLTFSSNSSECGEGEAGTTGLGSLAFPPRKKVKRHVDSKYQSEWLDKFRMRRSDRSETYAYCIVCNVDFSVAGGVFQVK